MTHAPAVPTTRIQRHRYRVASQTGVAECEGMVAGDRSSLGWTLLDLDLKIDRLNRDRALPREQSGLPGF
jgi:hypothetical protein